MTDTTEFILPPGTPADWQEAGISVSYLAGDARWSQPASWPVDCARVAWESILRMTGCRRVSLAVDVRTFRRLVQHPELMDRWNQPGLPSVESALQVEEIHVVEADRPFAMFYGCDPCRPAIKDGRFLDVGGVVVLVDTVAER